MYVGVDSVDLTRDEGLRTEATPASLAALKQSFRPDGTITAGNALAAAAAGRREQAALLLAVAARERIRLGTPVSPADAGAVGAAAAELRDALGGAAALGERWFGSNTANRVPSSIELSTEMMFPRTLTYCHPGPGLGGVRP